MVREGSEEAEALEALGLASSEALLSRHSSGEGIASQRGTDDTDEDESAAATTKECAGEQEGVVVLEGRGA